MITADPCNLFLACIISGAIFLFPSTARADVYLGIDGGLEGSATVDNSTTYSGGQSNKWTKDNADTTIAEETTHVRSGSKSVRVRTANATTARRIRTPFNSFASKTTAVTIQYYRMVTNTPAAASNQVGVVRSSTEQLVGSYDRPSSANTWEKKTYSPASSTFTSIVGVIMSRGPVAAGENIYIDDFCMYDGGADTTAPNSPGSLTVNGATTTSLDLSWGAASGGVDSGGYLAVRYASNPASGDDPNANGIYATNNTISGTVSGTVVYQGTGTSFTDSGLSSSATYYYKVYTYDKAYNYSAEVTGNGTTLASCTPTGSITFVQQTAYYTKFTSGGDIFNVDSSRMGMWANSGSEQVVAWRNFRTDGSGGGELRELQPGDRFRITINGPNPNGRVGVSINDGAATGSWDNRTNNTRGFIQVQGGGANDYFVTHGGGTPSWSGIRPNSTDQTLVFDILSSSEFTANIEGQTPKYDLSMLNSPGDNDRVDGFSLFLNDDAGDIHWKQVTVVTNLGYVEFGADNGTRNIAGKITDGMDPACTNTSSPNMLRKTGTGTVTLQNTANTYTRGTRVENGTLAIFNDASLGAVPGSAVATNIDIYSSGTLRATNSFTLNSNRGITLGNSSGPSIHVDTSMTLTYAGVIGGDADWNKKGSGVLALTGTSSTNKGKVSIQAGTLRIAGDQSLGVVPASAAEKINIWDTGTFEADGTFTLNANRRIELGAVNGPKLSVTSGNTLTYGGQISGSANWSKEGTGTLTLTGAVGSSSGTLTVNAGTLIHLGTNTAGSVTIATSTYFYGNGSIAALTITGQVSAGSASNTVGQLRVTSLNLQTNGRMQVNFSAMTGTAGSDWDLITVNGGSGTYTVNSGAGGEFVIALKGNPSFNNATGYTNVIVDAGTASGFNAAKFSVDTAEFTPTLGGGTFSVDATGGDLRLVFSPAVVATPDIDVIGTNGVIISNNDLTPAAADGTDFGAVYVAGAAAFTNVFTITNAGTAALTLSSVTTSSTMGAAADFIVVSWPGTVSPGAKSNLVIAFNPAALGVRTAVVSIANNVSGLNPYVFAVAGEGTGVFSTIVAQGFEGTTNDAWNYTRVPGSAEVYVDGGTNASGDYAMTLRGSASLNADPYVEFDSIDISGYASVTLEVAYAVAGADAGDDLELDLSFDGGVNWAGAGSVTLVSGASNTNLGFTGIGATTVAANPWYVGLPSTAKQVRVRIRFDESANDNSFDRYFFDDVRLTGMGVLPQVSFGGSLYVTSETNGTLTIPVSISSSASATVQVSLAGSALVGGGNDYTINSTNIVFSGGGATTSNLVITVNNDTVSDGLEDITLRLVSLGGARPGGPSVASVLIQDDETVSIMAANLTSGTNLVDGTYWYTESGQRILRRLLPDVVAIQEWKFTNASARAFVDSVFGTNYYFYIEPESDSNPIPNGVISRWPITASNEWTDAFVGSRDHVQVTIDIPGNRNLHVISTHFKAGAPEAATRESQARALTNYIALAAFPTNDYLVIAGDLNLTSRTEAAFVIITQIVTDAHQPKDRDGDTNTNLGRSAPYDHVLPNNVLDGDHVAINIAGYSFADGVVFDSEQYNDHLLPVLVNDSYEENRTHMAIMKLFTITTSAVAPSVTTTIASSTNATTATAGGNVTSDGGTTVTNRGVVWSTSAAPTVPGAQSTNGTGTGSFTATLTNLAPGATYFYRAFAQNGVGTSYGSEYSLTTPCFGGVVTGLNVTVTNEVDFTAVWSNVTGATGYALDVSTSSQFGVSLVTMAAQGFEGGGGDTWAYTQQVATVSTVTTTSRTGSTSLRIESSGEARFGNVPLSGFSGATVTVAFASLSVDSGEDLFIDFSYDGGSSFSDSVKLVDGFSNAQIDFNETNAVDPTTTANPYRHAISATQVLIRVRAVGLDASEYYYIDDVMLTAYGAGGNYIGGYSNRTVASTSASVTGLTGGVTYYYRVRATNDYCITENSATGSVTTVQLLPDVAVLGTNLSAIVISNASPVTANGTDFGVVGVNLSNRVHTFTITNSGNAALGVGTITTSGTHAADFVVLSQPSASIAAGASSTFQVRFDPSAAGQRDATLTFTNNVSGKTPLPFAVRGAGALAGIGYGPASTSITVMVGTTPSSASFGVTNVGRGRLDYAISSNVSWLSVSPVSANLNEGGSQAHTITFNVTGLSAGTSNATVTITDAAASNSPQVVAVTLVLTNIPDASAVTGWADGRELVRLGWTRPAGLDVMIVHRSTNAPTAPTQGQSYNVGDIIGGNGSRVIFKGSAAQLEHVIIPGQTNHYAFYSINNNHYSPGVATNLATTAYPAGEIVEPFAYTNTGTLATSGHGGGGNGWTNSWQGDTGNFNVSSGNFANISAYPTGAANRVRINSADIDGTSKAARRNFAAYTTGKVYAAYILNFAYNGPNKYAGMSFMDGTTEELFFGEGYNDDQKLAVGGTTTASNVYAGIGNDYLIVGMYDFAADTGYALAYKIGTDTVPDGEPSTWHGSFYDNSITRIDGVRIAAGAGGGSGTPGDTYFDEIRVATSWELLLANYAQPEIAVLGTNRTALTTANTPDFGNGSDFGAAAVAGGQVDRTLFITNSGPGLLNVSGVTTSGAQAADFIVVSWPTKVSPGSVSNLVLRFDPSAAGVRTGAVTVANDDADEGSYVFHVRGTGQVPPTVTSTIASATNQTTATAGGNVTDDGYDAVTNRGVVWSLSAAPVVPGAQTTNGTGTGSFTSTLTNLTPGATYYYRAFAQNSAGTSYGTEYTLATPCFGGVVTGLYASATNELNFTATWSNVVGASGYALDVSTNASFGEGAGGNYGVEVFTNVGGGTTSSYSTRQWTNNNVAWTSRLTRTDQTLDGAAITLQNASGAFLLSQTITGGVDEIRVTHQVAFTGNDSFDIFVNSIKVATNIAYSSSVQTAVVQGIGVTGDFTIMITNKTGGRVTLDNLTWSNTGSVASYVPGYSNRTVSGVSAAVTGLTGDITYYFRVRATNDYCATGNSTTASVTTIAGVPAVPGGVIASDGTSLTEVSVIWSNVASEQGYSIWRHTADVFGSASQLGSAAANTTNYSDTTATPGQLYYYWVTASNAVGSSAASVSDGGYRKLAVVTGVLATDIDNTNNTQIVVTWTDVTGETGYGIWRNTVDASNTATYVGSAVANATGFADTTAASDTTYYYWVRATNNTSSSQGEWSASDEGYAGIREPSHLSAASTGISSISLAFTQNVENSQIIIVYDLDGTFTTPSGAAPSIGAAFAGGTVVYKGAVSPQSHSSLAACTPYYYKIWSYDGTLYSQTGLTASATTDAPAAPTGLYVNPTNANNFTINWTASSGASGYRVDVSTNSLFGSIGTIRAQGFEAAVDDTWGFTTAGSVSTSTTRKRTGTYSLRLDGATTASATFDAVALSGTSASTVTVAFSASGPDTDEDLFLSVCTYTGGVLSSNTIKLVDGFSNADVAFNATNASNPTTVSPNPYSVAVSATATQVYLVVYATGLESGDYYYIDDISLSGQVGGFVDGYADRAVAGTSVSVTGLLQNTLYYYRVRAEGSPGCSGPNSLTGSVTTISSPIIGLSTNALNFGTIPVGVPSNLTLVVTNSGYANVVVSSISITGTCSAAFSALPSSFTVSPGTASNVVVTFTPAVTGACSATLIVSNNTPGDTAPTVSLTGTGYDPSSILAPTNITAVVDGAEMVVMGWTKVGGTPDVVVLWNSNAITATALSAGLPYAVGDSGPDGTKVVYHGSAAGGVELVVSQKSTNYFRLFGGAGTLYSTNHADPAVLPAETLKYETGEIIDQFAYTNNATLAQNNLATGQGWSGGWTGDTNKYTVIDTNLLHGATGFPDPYANKLFWQDTSTFSADSAQVTRMLGSARGGRIFVAFMMNYQYDGTEKYVGLSLMSGTNAATEEIFFGKLYGSVKTAGIEDPGAPQTTTASYDLEPGHGNDYMIVGELYPAQKTVRMWAFYQGGGAIPQDYTNATPVAIYSNSSLSVSTITGIRLAAGSSGTANKELGHVYFDEVRVGGTWDEVLNFNYPKVYDYQVGTRISGTNYVYDGDLVESGKTYAVSYTLYHRSGITNAQFTILDDVTSAGLYPTNVPLQFGANLAAGRQRYTNSVTNRLTLGSVDLGTYTSRVFMTASSGRATNTIVVAETGGASDLFFGEFGEGNNFDKYVEIYNGTGGAIDLSQYLLASQTTPGDKYVKWANWSRLSANTYWLDHGQTIVLLNGGLNGAVDVTDTVHSSMTNAMISANRPYLFTSNNVLQVSGDDPVALFRVGDTNSWVDVCGIGPNVARYIMRRVEDAEVPRSYPLQVDTNQWDYRDWDGDRTSGYTNFLATAGVYDRNVGIGGYITFDVIDDDVTPPQVGTNSAVLLGASEPFTVIDRTNGQTEVMITGFSFTNNGSVALALLPSVHSLLTNAAISWTPVYTNEMVDLDGGTKENSWFGANDQIARGQLNMRGIGDASYGFSATSAWIQIEFELVKASELTLSWAEQGGSFTFNTAKAYWSSDGVTFSTNALWPSWDPDTGGEWSTRYLEFAGVVPSGLSKVYIRFVLGPGFGGSSGYYRMDNIQLNGYPEEYVVTDGQLASSGALRFRGNLYDTNSGVNAAASVMKVSDKTGVFDGAWTGLGNGRTNGATIKWDLTLSASEITDFVVASAGGNGLPITVNLNDADNDRTGDALSLSAQLGQMRVNDDDTVRPKLELATMRPRSGIVAQWKFTNTTSRLPTRTDASVEVSEIQAMTTAGTVSTPRFLTNSVSGGYAVQQSGWQKQSKFWFMEFTPESDVGVTNISMQSRMSSTNGPTHFYIHRYVNGVSNGVWGPVYITGSPSTPVSTGTWYTISTNVSLQLNAGAKTTIRLHAFGCHSNYLGAMWAVYDLTFRQGALTTNGITEVTDAEWADGSFSLSGSTWDTGSGLASTNNATASKRPGFTLNKPDGGAYVTNSLLAFTSALADGGATNETAGGFANSLPVPGYTNVQMGEYAGQVSVWDHDGDRTSDDLQVSADIALYVVDNDVVQPGTVGVLRVNGVEVPGVPPTQATAAWTNNPLFIIGLDSVANDVPGEAPLSVSQRAAVGVGEYRVTTNDVASLSSSNRAQTGRPYPVATTNGALANYGFEMSATNIGWSLDANSSYQSLASGGTNLVKEGTNSLKQLSSGVASQLIEFRNAAATAPLIGVSGWYRSDAAGGPTFRVEAFATNNLVTPVATRDVALTATTGWSTFAIDPAETLGNGTVELLKVSLLAGNGNTYWDNLRFSVNIGVNTASLRFVATEENQGLNPHYLYAVDADNNRAGDRLAGDAKPFYTAYDSTPPPVSTGLRATDAAGGNLFGSIDESSEILVQWTPGGTNEAQAAGRRSFDHGALAPWDSYIITYSEVQDTNGSPMANATTTTLTRATPAWSAIFTNYAFTNLVLSNLVFDSYYRITIQGRDMAGNIGLSTSVIGNTDRFIVTQGVARTDTDLFVRWTGPTNESTLRDYDVLFVDSAAGFRSSLSNQWNFLMYTNRPTLVDQGGTNRVAPGYLTNGTYRFYRVAKQGRWQTNNTVRIGSMEVYATKAFMLYPGENWFSLFAYPDPATTNENEASLSYVFGTNLLPVGTSFAGATKISWFGLTDGSTNVSTVATATVWLGTSGWNWQVGGTGNANQKRVPLGQGFLIELPTTSTPRRLIMIGRLPTQELVHVISGRIGVNPEFHVLSQQMPERITMQQLAAQLTGFTGGMNIGSSDEIRVLDNTVGSNGVGRASLQLPKARIWYSTQPGHSSAPWRLASSGTPSAMNYVIEPEDAVIIVRRHTSALVWSNAPTMYIPPSKNFTP